MHKTSLTRPVGETFWENEAEGDNCNTPTLIQFARSFRKVFYQTCFSPSNGNCATDFDFILATVGTYCQNFVLNTAEIHVEKESTKSLDIFEADYHLL